jgi:hypothetical protein
MELSSREFWTVVHGMLLGAMFLLAFAGGIAELLGLRATHETPLGQLKSERRLIGGTWIMAVIAWLTVVTGTFFIYPWYRAKAPAGADLVHYPRSYLLAHRNLQEWHNFGMEWKEHVAWLAPILATAVAYVAWHYRRRIATDAMLRRGLLVLFAVAFFAAAAAGVFGAFINKVAATR